MASKPKQKPGLAVELTNAAESLKKRHRSLCVQARDTAEREDELRKQLSASKWSSPDGRLGAQPAVDQGKAFLLLRCETPNGFRNFAIDADTARGLAQWIEEMFGVSR